MELASEVLNDRNDPRSGTDDSVASDDETALPDGFEKLPVRAVLEGCEVVFGRARVRGSEDQEIRLKLSDGFQTDLGPILIRIDDGDGAGTAERVGDKSILSHGHERVRPHNKEYTPRRHAIELPLQSC